MITTTPPPRRSFANWLHSLPDWQFTGVLYLLRWAVIIPLAVLSYPFTTAEAAFQAEGDPFRYLLPFLVVAPVLETLLECALPYWLMYGLFRRTPQSPWPFVVVAALAMVVLHPLVPPVILFAFITGAFLGYVYVHFALLSRWKAFLHTVVFHAGINLIGWLTMLWNSFG